ncbi:AB hydrolase-1 domain-containing protein [Sphingomonas antarctica]|uniref:esterase/lipase family protein n=1 Tax=Sphingomonas antarctica TaxID=2040274 RepID=UPI0039E8CBCC
MLSKGSVVLLHGLGRGAGASWPLARYLKRGDYYTFAPGYPSRTLPLPAIVDRLRAQIADLDGPVHFVTHSYGGIVAHRLISTAPPANLGRVVMLAPPHGGSEWADLLVRLKLDRLVMRAATGELTTGRNASPVADYPLGIIAGTRALDPIFPRLFVPRPNDGKVSLASTRLEGMTDHIELPVSHTLMVWNPRVMAQVAAFLDTGTFTRAR